LQIICKGNTVKTGTHTQFHENIVEETTTTTERPTSRKPTQAPNTAAAVNATNATLPLSNFTTEEPELKLVVLPRWRGWRPKPDPVKKLNTKPEIETFSIEFPVTMEMMPSCGVMVYYVRHDKEVVADSIELDVEDKLENQVKIQPFF
jgi:hypothetical protein